MKLIVKQRRNFCRSVRLQKGLLINSRREEPEPAYISLSCIAFPPVQSSIGDRAKTGSEKDSCDDDEVRREEARNVLETRLQRERTASRDTGIR